MPKQEQEMFEKMRIAMTEEERIEQAYFFWNNFSMDGYETWREEQAAKVRE
jgi:hypothetical protein